MDETITSLGQEAGSGPDPVQDQQLREPPFESLGEPESSEPQKSVKPVPKPVNPVEPFTAQQIWQGSAFMLMSGLHVQNEEESQAFEAAFAFAIRPMLPTVFLLEQLKVGEALASWGFGPDTIFDFIEDLPAWARVAVAVGGLAMAGYSAVRAVAALRVKEDAGGED